MQKTGMAIVLVGLLAASSQAVITSTTTHGDANENGLAQPISSTDLIQGLIATELPGDNGWHSANTDPNDQLPAFTDGVGDRGTGLTGLLNDFPGAGNPTKLVEYDLGAPAVLTEIRVFTGNNGMDGRIFSTTRVFVSTDGGANFNPLGPNQGYYQSDPSGTLNNAGSSPRYGSTLVQIFDDGGRALAKDVTHLRFHFFSVDNTLGEMRDPFDGVNPYTGTDDGLSAAFVSPLVREIDVLPEPATALLLLAGLPLLLRRRRA